MPETDPKIHAKDDFSVNSEQVRLKMRSLVQPFSGLIVANADQILTSTTNSTARREALLWKIDAVPALREALFQPNPVTAVADTWVLTFQMTDYFERGPGRDRLGPLSSIAVETSRQLEAEMSSIAASLTVSGDVSKTRLAAQKWAAEHPIQFSIAGRESSLNRVTEREIEGSFSTMEAVGNLTISVDDLQRRLEVYSAQIPEQARWQAELFGMDLTKNANLDQAIPLATTAVQSAERAVNSLDQIIPSIERTLSVVEQAPEFISSERKAAIEAMQSELSRTIAFFHEERIAALQHLTAERIAAIKDLQSSIANERRLLVAEMDEAAIKVVDHAFVRAAQLVALCLVALFVGSALLLLLARRLLSGTRASPVPSSGNA